MQLTDYHRQPCETTRCSAMTLGACADGTAPAGGARGKKKCHAEDEADAAIAALIGSVKGPCGLTSSIITEVVR